jgi:hypothetical protein
LTAVRAFTYSRKNTAHQRKEIPMKTDLTNFENEIVTEIEELEKKVAPQSEATFLE